MLFRILTVREHKTMTFCDSYSYELHRQQLMISNDISSDYKLSVGTVINAEWHFDINRRRNQVVFIDKIIDVFLPQKTNPYKSFAEGEEKVIIKNWLVNGLNGGVELLKWKHNVLLIGFIQDYLSDLGIMQVNTPILTSFRGTSVANPAFVRGDYIGEQYIKITHELELKKLAYLTLAPVFEFGYVVRDRYVTKTGLNEFLMLEAVLPCDFNFDLKLFYLKVIEEAIRLADEIGLKYNPMFNEISVIDVLEEYKKENKVYDSHIYNEIYNIILENNKHVILMNAPLDSPLGQKNEFGMPVETQWNLCDHGIGHGYMDEYRTDILVQEFSRQKDYLKSKGVEAQLPEDYLEYCMYASIPTFSFNLGIERFNQFFFEIGV